MAVKQYIGARYVPKFFVGPNGSHEWLREYAYEPLTIVSHLGASYTSRKPVPVGIEITNTEYWVLTANYQGQITDVVERVNALTEIVDGVNDKVNAVEESVKHNITFLNNKKVMIIGDSLTDETTMPPNWVTLFKNYCAEYGEGITVNTDFCMGGDSYAGIGQADRLAAFDNYTNEFDIIIVALGINDYQGQWGVGYFNDTAVLSSETGYNGYNFVAGMNNLYSKLRQKFPKAIQFATIPHRSGREISNMKTPLAYYRYAIGSVAQYYGISIIDMSCMPMFAPRTLGNNFGGYTSDGDVLHPSNIYAPILCDYILKKLRCGGDPNWKTSGDRIVINCDANLIHSENQLITVTFYSNGNIYFDGAITVNADVTPGSYLQFTVPLNNYIVKQSVLTGIPCFINGETPTCIKAHEDRLYVRIPSGVTHVSTIFINTTTTTSRPMRYYEGSID